MSSHRSNKSYGVSHWIIKVDLLFSRKVEIGIINFTTSIMNIVLFFYTSSHHEFKIFVICILADNRWTQKVFLVWKMFGGFFIKLIALLHLFCIAGLELNCFTSNKVLWFLVVVWPTFPQSKIIKITFIQLDVRAWHDLIHGRNLLTKLHFEVGRKWVFQFLHH